MPRWDFRPHGTIVDPETFVGVTELETRQAARLQYAVSMLTIHRSGDHQVADDADAAEQLAEVVSPVVRSTDLIEVVPSAATVRVLLVGGELEDLRGIVQRIIAEASCYRSGEQPSLVVSIGGSCFPATAANSQELLLQADTLAEEVRRERGQLSTYRLYERPDTS
jgi:GGDEF domain-containing protein